MMGIEFRERDAGPKIDEHMNSEGKLSFAFNLKISFKVSTCEHLLILNRVWYLEGIVGIVEHGWIRWVLPKKQEIVVNQLLRGKPVTPMDSLNCFDKYRDGAAVELQGLALRVSRALEKLHNEGSFPYPVLKGILYTQNWMNIEHIT